MNVFTALTCVVLALAVGACELTQPDSDDMLTVERAVAGLPPSAKQTLKYIEFRRAVEATMDDDPNMPVGHVACEGKPDVPVPLKALLAFMNAYEAAGTGSKSVDEMIARFNAALSEHGCTFVPGPGTDVAWEKPTRSDQSNRHLAELAIALTTLELTRFSSLASELGLVLGAGGVWYAMPGIGIGLTLCVLSASIACPDDPGAPGVPQPAPSPGGGDHR